MGVTKKSYSYHFWAETNPTKIKKNKTTGLAHVRRDWCEFTRQSLQRVVTALLAKKSGREIMSIIDSDVNRLLSGQVRRQDLLLTKKIEQMEKYKSFEAVHLNVVNKTMTRRRLTHFPQDTRVEYYVVDRMINDRPAKLWQKGEAPEIVEREKMKLDIEYYLKNQYFKPMQNYLQWNARARHAFIRKKASWLKRAQNARNGITCSFQALAQGHAPSLKRPRSHTNQSSTGRGGPSKKAKNNGRRGKKREFQDLYAAKKGGVSTHNNPFLACAQQAQKRKR